MLCSCFAHSSVHLAVGDSELGLLYIDPTSQQIGGNEDTGRPRTKLTLEGECLSMKHHEYSETS